MENREITIEELEIGDEVIIHGSGCIRYVKLLQPFKPVKKINTWNSEFYSSIKCSWKETRSWSDRYGKLSGENHDKTGYIDFNYRNIWLVKRENNN